MKPTYKQVKIMKPHCPKCKEMLSGDNSISFPYKCKCGVWETEDGFDFKIKKDL